MTATGDLHGGVRDDTRHDPCVPERCESPHAKPCPVYDEGIARVCEAWDEMGHYSDLMDAASEAGDYQDWEALETFKQDARTRFLAGRSYSDACTVVVHARGTLERNNVSP